MMLRAAIVGLCVLGGMASVRAAEPTAEQTKFFETKIRPLLVEKCQSCHGAEKQKSGLRLDSRQALLEGGESGPAFDVDKPEKSLLLEAVEYSSLQMPPDRKLPDAEIAAIKEWLKQGAPWPGQEAGAVPVRKRGLEVTDADRAFWSFQPLQRPVPPAVKQIAWVQNPIDRFILAKLEAEGLTPNGAADPRSLARRLSFDLLGLPPTAALVERLSDPANPAAYEQLVDETLTRPEFGERWGRHWLDLVRFAQSNGLERDDEKPNAWRYRDYVIRALNEDKPYDLFVKEQLAGDELDVVTDDGRIGVGFFRLGVWDDEPDDKRQAEFDELDDMLSTTGSVFLGLTIGCARCHDHKFDPLPQEDYYSLLAFLRNIKPYANPGKDAEEVVFAPLSSGGQALTVHERDRLLPTHVLARGSAGSPGKEVAPRFPLVLSKDAAAASPALPEKSLNGRTSGRRRALAEWVARRENPLFARVIVNRLWHSHFGRGLVATPNDFGHTGTAPTHPELLDYLASELIAHDWQLKPIHRLILQSATYRQSSTATNAAGVAKDPGNQLWWRQSLRRLDAESIRDAMLATAGTLNPQMTGRGIFPSLPPEVLATQSQPGRGWDRSNPAEQARRSVYIFVKRTLGVPQLEAFDLASPDSSQAARSTTTIAPQALILLNGSFTNEQARAFAQRILMDGNAEFAPQLEAAFRIALSRPPTEHERAVLTAYFEQQRALIKDQQLAAITQPAIPEQPLGGWSTYQGKWSLREDGGYQVEPHPGAKALWDATTFRDGEVEAEVWVGEGADAGLLVRATEPKDGTDSVHAYNINLSTGAGRLRLGKHRNNWQSVKEVRSGWERGRWLHVRVVAEGPRIRIYLNKGTEPLIDYVDPEPLLEGKIGFRTFQAQAAVRNIVIRSSDQVVTVPMKPATTADSPTNRAAIAAVSPTDRAALAAVCKVVLNLNEFVYVD